MEVNKVADMLSKVLFLLLSLQFSASKPVNMELMGGHMEGDMMSIPSADSMANKSYMWPNRVIPYAFDADYPDIYKKQIRRAMNEFHRYTCVRFREKNETDHDYVLIKEHETMPQCSSHVGKIGGKQNLYLTTTGCVSYLGTIIHELMHVLGFHHEHSRKDRDNYITILYDNIPDDKKYNFRIINATVYTFNLTYNPRSLMHYSLDAFTKKTGLHTIKPKDTFKNATFGQRVNFSGQDILKVLRMYDCPKDERFDFEQFE